jgi:hypothetical protein
MRPLVSFLVQSEVVASTGKLAVGEIARWNRLLMSPFHMPKKVCSLIERPRAFLAFEGPPRNRFLHVMYRSEMLLKAIFC